MPMSPSSISAAASVPQFYSNNYAFATAAAAHDLEDFFPIPQSLNNNNNVIMMDNINAGATWQDHHGFIINHHPVDHNNNNNIIGALDHVLSLDCEIPITSYSGGVVSDFAVPAIISDCKTGLYNNNNNMFHHQSYSYHQQPRVVVGEFGEECCGYAEDVKPTPVASAAAHPNAARDNWGINHQMAAGAVEEPNIKVGRYSEEERKERILRYLKKRNQRNFNKTIKYACRKTLADRRVRVRGRFARNNELCEEDHMATTKKHHDHESHHLIKEDHFYGGDSIQFQLKNDEEDWLQEAMASLVYLSHSSPEDM